MIAPKKLIKNLDPAILELLDEKSQYRNRCERLVLSMLITTPKECFPIVATIIGEQDFSDLVLQKVFRLLESMQNSRETIDFNTVLLSLHRNGVIAELGNEQAFEKLVGYSPNYDGCEFYANEISRLSASDKAFCATFEATNRLANKDADASTELQILAEVASDCAPSRVIESGNEVLDNILCRDTSPSTVIETDCPNLNRKLGGGFRTGKLILVGGRFGKGKTAFGCQSVASAIRQGFKVLTISMEMSSAEMYQRIISAECGIPMSAWTRPLTQSETQVIREYRDTTRNAVWRIDDRSNQSVRTIQNAAKLMKLREGLDFILIDNLQLLQFEGDSKTQDSLQLTQISKRLKIMSRELDVAIMLLCQLDTDAGKPGALPNSTSWARAKAIEGDADVAMMIHQIADDKPDEYLLIATKMRDTKKFIIPILFEGAYQRFSDRPPETNPESGYSFAEDF